MDMKFWPTYPLDLCPNFFSLKNMVWANPTYLWFDICPNFRSFFFGLPPLLIKCVGPAPTNLNNSYIMFEWLGIFSNQIGNGIISRMWLRTIPLSDDLKRWLQLSPHRQVEKFRDQYCTSTPRYWFLAVGWVLGATLYEIWNRKIPPD